MSKLINIEEVNFEKFQKGDSCAFEFFFKKYYNNIVGFSTQFVYDKEVSKNITQDVFEKLWVNREKIDKTDRIPSFLYKCAKNQCLNWLRHKKVEQKYVSLHLQERENTFNLEVLNSLKFDSMTIEELEQLIKNSISELPEKCRVVFLKKRMENKKNKEIAIELGISLKAVEANMTRALKSLNIKLANYLTLFCLLTSNYFL